MDLERTQRLKWTAKKLFAGLLSSALGRRNMVRLARFLTNESRLDGPNVMALNGETAVQRLVLERGRGRERLEIVDVGANVGDWSAHLLMTARDLSLRNIRLHCFEPAPRAADLLEERLKAFRGEAAIDVVRAAASSSDGEATLHLVGDSTGVNSLHARDDIPEASTLAVPLRSLDSFAREYGVERFALVKCDAEGHDFAVIEGATGLLRDQRIDAFQFEYNWRWVDSRHFLRDAFELAQASAYALGKITPHGVEWYEKWHPELESFREGNYLLATPEVVRVFPRVTWWNAPSR